MKILKLKEIVLLIFITMTAFTTGAQQKTNMKVAIFMYEGMELLDFAGPAEVFSATNGFDVYSVSLDGKPLRCNATGKILNEITPNYSMDNAPLPDIILFPGGGSQATSKNENVIQWVKDLASKGTFLMSVCTGARILVNTGLLEGKNITTWYGFIPVLQTDHPELNVLENTRFVDNGIYITTAGVSAGIDGALHLVSRIKGVDVAMATAKYMEYDKWNPGDGRIDFENAYIKQLRDPVAMEKMSSTIPKGKEKPYEGELRNLAFEFRDNGQLLEAAKVLEICIKLYPNSAASYAELGQLYKKLGRPAPNDEESILTLLNQGKVNEAVVLFENDQKAFPGWITLSHNKLLNIGYNKFMEEGDYKNALKVFQICARLYPDSFYVFDSLGEVYLKLDDKKEALANYRKSVELNPQHEDGKKIITEIEKEL